MNLNRVKRRVGVVAGIWSALAAVDAVQATADKTETDLANAREAEKRAADRATQASRAASVAISAAASAEAKLAALNPFAGVIERA